MTDHLEAALAYAADGWKVFPLQPGSKVPATSHGFKDATDVTRTIRHWWRHHPDYNIGIATGYPGPDVLDIDVRHGKPGDKSVGKLFFEIPPPCRTNRTPSGGLHLYYRGTKQGNHSLAKHGVDFRSKGGYVVAPPSWSEADGAGWKTLDTSDWYPQLLDWELVKKVLEPEQSPRRVGHTGPDSKLMIRLQCTMSAEREGNRNSLLFYCACTAVENGLDPWELVKAARQTGLEDWEIEQTISAATRKVGSVQAR